MFIALCFMLSSLYAATTPTRYISTHLKLPAPTSQNKSASPLERIEKTIGPVCSPARCLILSEASDTSFNQLYCGGPHANLKVLGQHLGSKITYKQKTYTDPIEQRIAAHLYMSSHGISLRYPCCTQWPAELGNYVGESILTGYFTGKIYAFFPWLTECAASAIGANAGHFCCTVCGICCLEPMVTDEPMPIPFELSPAIKHHYRDSSCASQLLWHSCCRLMATACCIACERFAWASAPDLYLEFDDIMFYADNGPKAAAAYMRMFDCCAITCPGHCLASACTTACPG